MHDLFQTYPTVGTYAGMTTPSSLPYTSLQPYSINPMAGVNPAAILGMSGPSQIAQQLQTAATLAAQAVNPMLGLSPWTTGLYNPLQTALIANPLIAAALQNPFLNAGQQNPIFGGQQNPFQPGPWGNPLSGAGLGNPYFGGFQNPALNPIYAGHNPWQQGGLFGQQHHSPYSQLSHLGSQLGQFGQPLGSPYGQTGYPLAPQSWVGQGGPFGGQGYGQVHPLLQQIGMRPYQGAGIGSWG